MSELLPCPPSDTEVHRSTFYTLDTATGTSNVLSLSNDPNFPGQSPVAMCPALQLLPEFSHLQLFRCEQYGGRVLKPSRTVAAKLPHTCGLVHEVLVV